MASLEDNHEDSPLTKLIRAAADGDEQAQFKLYKEVAYRFRRWAYGHLLGLGCREFGSHSEEVGDEALGNVFMKLGTLDSPYAFFRYGRETVRNGALNHQRKCSKVMYVELPHPRSDDESGEESITGEPAELYSTDESIEAAIFIAEVLHLAVKYHQKLPDILTLKFFWGYDSEEVGERVGESAANVRNIPRRHMPELQRKILGVEGLKKIVIDKEKKEERKNEKKPDVE